MSDQLVVLPSFDPAALPVIGAPLPWVQPWQWLADPAVDPDLKAAYLKRFGAGFGPTDPTSRDVELKPRSHRDVIASHVSQEVVLELAGSKVRLSRCGVPDAGGLPFAGPVAIIGTAAPAARAVDALGRNLHDELVSYLRGSKVAAQQAVAVDVDRRWVESVIIADYRNDAAVRLAASMHLQPFLTVWREAEGRSVVDVIDLSVQTKEQLIARGSAGLSRLQSRPCPLIPGADLGDICQMHGGPWVSRSITAALRWQANRSRMLAALGCDTCGDGEIRVFGKRQVVRGAGGAVAVRPPAPRQSRHDILVAVGEE